MLYNLLLIIKDCQYRHLYTTLAVYLITYTQVFRNVYICSMSLFEPSHQLEILQEILTKLTWGKPPSWKARHTVTRTWSNSGNLRLSYTSMCTPFVLFMGKATEVTLKSWKDKDTYMCGQNCYTSTSWPHN